MPCDFSTTAAASERSETISADLINETESGRERQTSPDLLATPLTSPAAAGQPQPAGFHCLIPSFDSEWHGRDQADRWVPGLYPSDPRSPGTLVLTFDDGPRSETAEILDLLAAHNMPATFFVVGRLIDEDNFSLIQRMIAEGHTIGNHTWDHDTRMTMSEDAAAVQAHVAAEYEMTQMIVDLALLAEDSEEFTFLHDRLFEATGRPRQTELADVTARVRPVHAEILREYNPIIRASPYPMVLSRPPGGSPYFGRSIPNEGRIGFANALRELGLLNVMWTDDTGDSNSDMTPAERADPERIRRVFLEAGEEGSILLAHDRINLRALETGLEAIADEPSIDVVSIEQVLAAKYACQSPLLGVQLGHATAEVYLAAAGYGMTNELADLRTQAAGIRAQAAERELVGSTVQLGRQRIAESARTATSQAVVWCALARASSPSSAFDPNTSVGESGIGDGELLHTEPAREHASAVVAQLLRDPEYAEDILRSGLINFGTSLDDSHTVLRAQLLLAREHARELGVETIDVLFEPDTINSLQGEPSRELTYYRLARRGGAVGLVPIVERDVLFAPLAPSFEVELTEQQRDLLRIIESEDRRQWLRGTVQLWVEGYASVVGLHSTAPAPVDHE